MPLKLLLTLLRWEHSNNIDDLREAIGQIVSTQVQFNLLKDDKQGGQWEATTMMSYGSIAEGVVSWRYDEAMARKLHDPSVYARISTTAQHELTSSFSWALYEQCVRFRKTHRTGVWSIELFRQLIGATAATYDEFKYLSQRVIAPAVKEINKVTDICIEPTFERTGRRITGINFRVEETRQPSLLTVNLDNFEITAPDKEWIERMQRLDIRPKLAMNLLRQYDKNHLEETLRYIETEERNGRVKKSPGGYLLTMLKLRPTPQADAKIPSAAAPVLQRPAVVIAPVETIRKVSPMSLEIQQRIDGLTRTERVSLARDFLAAHPDAALSFSEDEGNFTQPLSRLRFKTWLFSRWNSDEASGRQ